MTPEQELRSMWPFPMAKPHQGPKADNKASTTPAFITGARGSDSITMPMPGTVGGAQVVFPTVNSYTTVGDSTIEVLDERAKNYGPFKDMAAITQKLKEILHAAPTWKNMQADQQESLEMIVHKIARILNGKPDYADSWVDIAGYARLVSERLEKGIIR